MSVHRRRDRLAALFVGVLAALALAWVGTRIWRRSRPAVTLRQVADPLLDSDPERAQYAGAWNPATAPAGRRHLPRFPIPESLAKRLFPIRRRDQPFDPLTYVRHLANRDDVFGCEEHAGGTFRMRTNSLGMREDTEPSAVPPDLRILVTGDSHVDGVCDNSESFPNVLEAQLARAHPGRSIEALNAAKGSFNFYSYVGTLEKFLDLRPDVFVVAVYGPNDFEETLSAYHFFAGTPRPPGAATYREEIRKAIAIRETWLAQEGLSLKYFQRNPGEIPVALAAAELALLDIEDLCRDRSIGLLVVYLPGLFDTYRRRGVRDEATEALMHRLDEALELETADLGVHDRMADELLQFLAARGIATLDARAVFAGKTGPFFWKADFHLDVDGHRAIGEALVPAIEQLAAGRLR